MLTMTSRRSPNHTPNRKPARTSTVDLPQARLGFAILTVALMLFICWQAFAARSVGFIELQHADKVLHFLAFAVLAVTLRLSSRRAAPLGWGACLALLAYGVFIEVVQSFVPEREASLLDLVADAAGIAAGRACGGVVQAVLRKIF